MTTAWTADCVRKIDLDEALRIPRIVKPDPSQLVPGRIYWDMWPIQERNGQTASIHGRELWMALTAPARGDPSLRHFEAKIHLLERRNRQWFDLGPSLPEFPVPYEREWAGSAVTHDGAITLYFTAAGTRQKAGGYQQHLWETSAQIGSDGLPCNWSIPAPSIDGYGQFYMPADAHEGETGKIKAFRDPAYFCDPADGKEYLAFTASIAGSPDPFNGAFGLAVREPGGWQLLPPLITANGVNNELERAHIVFHQNRYVAFWSTQSSTFEPSLRAAPNGIYGMVSESLRGPYRPLNGSGLVAANPSVEPFQTYSWYVDAGLNVCSFVDFWNLDGKPIPPAQSEINGHFGGVPAPLFQLELEGDRCVIASAAKHTSRLIR